MSVGFLAMLSGWPCVYSEELRQPQAIELAETFILENGYTDAPREEIKERLDFESLEWMVDRQQLLQQRFDSLRREAIGIRPRRRGGPGWSVAFAFVHHGAHRCRVVTMNPDGTQIRIEHVDGLTLGFLGFGNESVHGFIIKVQRERADL